MSQGQNNSPGLPDPLLELYQEASGMKEPPKADLVKRAKSYSDFYDVAISSFGKQSVTETPKDIFETSESAIVFKTIRPKFEDFEDELLDESHEEYR